MNPLDRSYLTSARISQPHVYWLIWPYFTLPCSKTRLLDPRSWYIFNIRHSRYCMLSFYFLHNCRLNDMIKRSQDSKVYSWGVIEPAISLSLRAPFDFNTGHILIIRKIVLYIGYQQYWVFWKDIVLWTMEPKIFSSSPFFAQSLQLDSHYSSLHRLFSHIFNS